jgi:SNF family Na+-dependent transporter
MTSIETTITSILDVFPMLKVKKNIKLFKIKSKQFEINNLRKYLTITAICVIHFLFGIVYTFKSGTYWVELVDSYSGSWSLFLIGFIECISITWFYGKKK